MGQSNALFLDREAKGEQERSDLFLDNQADDRAEMVWKGSLPRRISTEPVSLREGEGGCRHDRSYHSNSPPLSSCSNAVIGHPAVFPTSPRGGPSV